MAAIILGSLAVDDDFSLSPPRPQSYRLQPVVVFKMKAGIAKC